MNNSTISAVPPVPQQPASNAAPVVVKVESLPQDIQPNTVISGQVVANQNNQVTIQTSQGNVILDAALNIEVGQSVNLKIQVAQQATNTQTITQNFVAELLNVSADKVSKADNLALRPPPVQATQPIVDQPPVDPVIVHDAKAYEEYKPLQALILQMPDILNDETMDVMVKSVLKLPMQQPLPPGLQDSFQKFDQLVKLLSQANLFPSNVLQSSETSPGIQQNIISTLQQLLQNVTGKTAENNPLVNQEPHQFIQLQTIQPGENLSPNILVNIKDQLKNLLQQQSSPAFIPSVQSQVEEKAPGFLQSLLPNTLSSLVDKAAQAIQSKLPDAFTAQTPALSSPKTQLYTLPAIGLVLGAPPKEVPQLGQANLVLMTTPLKQDGQQLAPQHLIALLAPQQEDAHAPLLPGSIIVAALKPQADKMTSFVALPQEMLPQIIDDFAPLHPSLGDTWPALDDLWQELISQAPASGQQAASPQNPIQQIIPTPTVQQFPPATLFFLSVIRNDLTSQWIPEKHLAGIEGLNKAALIKTLTDDLQAIKSRMEDAAPSDSWRPLPLPLQVGDQLMRLQWFYRHPENSYQRSQGEEQSDTPKKRKTRFLVNVPKTMVGDLQIDGLVQEKNLDLILRTESVLPSHIETAIRGRYTAALETTGMQGQINFQFGRDHYVHV